MIITTTDILQGIEIGEYLGLIQAETVDAGGGAAGKTARKMRDAAIKDLEKELKEIGEELGADAIIGLKISFEKLWIRCIGTAVKFK